VEPTDRAGEGQQRLRQWGRRGSQSGGTMAARWGGAATAAASVGAEGRGCDGGGVSGGGGEGTLGFLCVGDWLRRRELSFCVEASRMGAGRVAM